MGNISRFTQQMVVVAFAATVGWVGIVTPTSAEPIYMTDSEALFKLRYAQFPMQDASAPNEFTTGDAALLPRRTLTPRAPIVSTEFITNPCTNRPVFLRKASDGGPPFIWSPLNSSAVSATAPSGAKLNAIGYAPGAPNADDCWGIVRRGELPEEDVAELVSDDPITTDDVPSFIPARLITPPGIIPNNGGTTILTNIDCIFVTDANGNIACSSEPTSDPPAVPPTPSTSSSSSSGPPPGPPSAVSEPAPFAMLIVAGLFALFRRNKA